MSESTQSISSTRFAAALKDLTLSSLYAKAAEIRNSTAHLKRSNEEMQPLVEQGDSEFAEHVCDNLSVIRKNEGRLRLLRIEVEDRGATWQYISSDELRPGQLTPKDKSEEYETSSMTSINASSAFNTNQNDVLASSLDDIELPRQNSERVLGRDDNHGVFL